MLGFFKAANAWGWKVARRGFTFYPGGCGTRRIEWHTAHGVYYLMIGTRSHGSLYIFFN